MRCFIRCHFCSLQETLFVNILRYYYLFYYLWKLSSNFTLRQCCHLDHLCLVFRLKVNLQATEKNEQLLSQNIAFLQRELKLKVYRHGRREFLVFRTLSLFLPKINPNCMQPSLYLGWGWWCGRRQRNRSKGNLFPTSLNACCNNIQMFLQNTKKVFKILKMTILTLTDQFRQY